MGCIYNKTLMIINIIQINIFLSLIYSHGVVLCVLKGNFARMMEKTARKEEEVVYMFTCVCEVARVNIYVMLT